MISLRKDAKVFIPSSKTYLLSSKQLKLILFMSYVQMSCKTLCILFILCLTTFLLNNTSTYSLCLNFRFTPFALLTSLSFSTISEYIL